MLFCSFYFLLYPFTAFSEQLHYQLDVRYVDGEWSEWSTWTACSVFCGEGVKSRERQCDSPPPTNGGRDCAGGSEQRSTCLSAVECPKDGGWSDWTKWSACSVTSGDGFRYRYRECDNPPPSQNGEDCDGNSREARVCKSKRKRAVATDELPNKIKRHVIRCQADDLEPWSYRGENGPQFWAEAYPECRGLNQSPIHIDTDRVETNRNLPKMTIHSNHPIVNALVTNIGHTIQVTPGEDSWSGMHINGIYFRLSQIHFHWGSVPELGSEHVVDGERYSMEMHLIHRNMHDNRSIAVVAVFFKEVKKINPELQHIVKELPKVMYRDNEIRMRYHLHLLNLLPENPASYYRYEGSLTTPNCTEGVLWSVFKVPNYVGRKQMREFRKLFSSPQNMAENGCRISNNFRPVQHLHRRRVFSSL